jgi:two-component system OmpR family sensor kinase
VPDTSSPPEPATPGAKAHGWIPELTWAGIWLLGLVNIVTMPGAATVSFYLIWICFALLYGLRVWPWRAALWRVALVTASTAAADGLDVLHGSQDAASLSKVPLMAAMFCAVVWQAHRRVAADQERLTVSAENERLLAAQRRFLQDASHQLKTPITIALGHAELLARDLASRDDKRDIHVVVGELNRLKSLSERLLLIAASENPDFLRPEPVALSLLAVELLRRWRPAAPRRWQIGQLDDAMVTADPERLALAADALLENAVQHTGENDVIRVSVVASQRARFATVVIEDSGAGIPSSELSHIFDRFRSAPAPGAPRGTGLGLALAQAIARGHGGEVRVRSDLGHGSRFEFWLPVLAAPAALASPATAVAGDDGIPALAVERSR